LVLALERALQKQIPKPTIFMGFRGTAEGGYIAKGDTLGVATQIGPA
jgi:hypothetical protein